MEQTRQQIQYRTKQIHSTCSIKVTDTESSLTSVDNLLMLAANSSSLKPKNLSSRSSKSKPNL